MAKFVFLIISFLTFNLAFGASYSYWQNGWRKNTQGKVDDILVVETPLYLFSLDTKDLSYSYFGSQHDDFVYGGQVGAFKDITKQKKVPLEIAINVGGDKYIAKSARAGKLANSRPLQDVLLWESGRYFHHYDFKDIEFFNAKGELLELYADLKLCAWQNNFALSLNAKNAEVSSFGFIEGVEKAGYCVGKEKLTIPAKDIKESAEFSAGIWIKVPEKLKQVSNERGVIFVKDKHMGAEGAWGIRVDNLYYYNAFLKAGETFETSTTQLKEGWNLLIMTYGANKLKLYANGKQVGKTVDIKNPLALKPADITLGGRGDKNAEIYSMCIDEFRIWDKALSDSEIKGLYDKKSVAVENLTYEKNFNEGKFLPKKTQELKDVKLSLRLGNYSIDKAIASWGVGQNESLTLAVPSKEREKVSVKVSKAGVDYPVDFDTQKQCYVATVGKEKRADGFVNAANYDDFNLSVKAEGKVPFLLHLNSPASITGLCPVLCNKDGSPTGIAVQLSKNWHERNMGSYLMAYTEVPKGEYILRIVYGFYGKYPSASHSNLSLVGYGGSGRWEQLAIGAWGETICFDADSSLTTTWITDIRMLMARDGENGRMWGWTNAGWGGDWLNIKTQTQERLLPVGLKTSYISQGPCLSDVRYNGYLGEGREVSISSQIQTLRTNDYARTFQRVEYLFNKDVNAKEFSIYYLKNLVGNLALGDKSGLLEEYKDEKTDKSFSFGKAVYPLWISAMGRKPDKAKGVGYKALAIRAFEAKIAGKNYDSPLVAFKGGKSMDLTLPSVKKFKRGDRIFFDIELFTLHAYADDYYGDDEVYIKHLEDNPMSYKTAMREALGNDLKIALKGGKLLRAYPIEISANTKQIELEIDGGVGLVPLMISNLASKDFTLYEILPSGKLERFDQSVKGNDFYQVDYDEHKKTYSLIYNLPLNGKKSKWCLK